jgi:hypothetical protein
MSIYFRNIYHGGHGVSRRKKKITNNDSVFLRVLRGFIFLSMGVSTGGAA